MHSLYAVDAGGSYGHRYELDRSVSTPSVNSSHLDTNDSHQYQGLSDILEESECKVEPEETEYSTILVVDEDGDVSEMGDGTVRSEIQTGGGAETPTWTTALAVSRFFCLPTTESSLAPPTPSETESGPSTPRYMPVLVYESASYEDALFTEFKAIIDWKAANESVE